MIKHSHNSSNIDICQSKTIISILWSRKLRFHFFIYLSLSLLFLNCKEENATDISKIQKTELEECDCPIEKLDIQVENMDNKTKYFLDTFSIGADLNAEIPLKKIIDVNGGIDGKYLIANGKEISSKYIGKSDYSGDPIFFELAIVRNIYCAVIKSYCQQGKHDLIEEEVVEFKKYMLGKLNGQVKSEPQRFVTLKVIHGPNHKGIFLGKKKLNEIPNKSNLDFKSFKVPVGNHLLRIEYNTGNIKEKNISINDDSTISHLSF